MRRRTGGRDTGATAAGGWNTPETSKGEGVMEAGGEQAPLALDQIQGNIAGFNKPFQSFVALRFEPGQKARDFIHAVLREIDTAAAVEAFNRRYKWHRKRGGQLPTSEWFNLLLSAKGLEALEAPELEQFPAEFREGMRARAAAIGDVDRSAPEQWDPLFNEEIHAFAVLAADSEERLTHWKERIAHHARAHRATIVGTIDGRVRDLGGPEQGHEHFGFKDGVSQPGIAGLTEGEGKPGQQLLPAGEFILGQPRLGEEGAPKPDGYEPNPPPPPLPFPEWARNGSFAVFRRLRQDVAAFRQFLAENAAATGGDAEMLGAKLVGRYKSGAPLEMTRKEAEEHGTDAGVVPADTEERADPSVSNDFGYEPQDGDGHLVPRGAHIRKTFPRDEQPPGQPDAERHRILRRGIPYGPEFEEGEAPYGEAPPPDERDRGLVFLCYQASIGEQFEVVQRRWADNLEGEFPQAGDSKDPIIAQDESDEPSFAFPPDHVGEAHLAVKRWVQNTGGEYLFSPSIDGLKVLSGR
jgi:Dyp-type peroxidase family